MGAKSKTESELRATRERWIETIQAPVCRRVAELWCEAAGDQILPRRAQMGPRHLKDVLTSIAIMECLDPDTIIVRLHGERLRAMLGHAITGLNILDFAEPKFRPVRAARYKAALSFPCGMLYVAPAIVTSGLPVAIETVLLPILADRDDAPMQILVVSQEIQNLDLWPGDRLSTFEGITKVFDEIAFLDLGNGIPDPDPGLALMPL